MVCTFNKRTPFLFYFTFQEDDFVMKTKEMKSQELSQTEAMKEMKRQLGRGVER